jgi:hypothetical protein
MDNDFPTVMSGNDFLTSYLKKYGGGEQYSQTGTNIPTFSVGRDFEGGEGTGIPPYFNEELRASPNFDEQYRPLEIAQGVPVGQDENLPMSQEAFRDAIYTLQEKKRGALTKPVNLSPGLLNRMRSMRSQYGI